MPTLQYTHSAPPIGGTTVFFSTIYGSCEKTEVANIGSTNVYNANPALYGVNGTFYELATGNLVRMSVMHGTAIRPGGDQNRVNAGTFIIYTRPSQTTLRTIVQRIQTESQFTGGNVKMAVSGIDLRVSEPFANESTFNAALEASDGAGYPYSARRHRTALVAFPDEAGSTHSNLAMIAVFTFPGNTPSNPDMQLESMTPGAVSAWLLREYIRTYHPSATGAVMLDGGGSTQIVAQVNNVRKGILTGNGTPMFARNVYTMVRTPWSW